MPLDAVAGSIRLTTLAERLEQHDIRPVEWATLNAHKQSQLQAFGPSFWFRHRRWLSLGLISAVAAMALAAGAAPATMSRGSTVAMWAACCLVCGLATLILGGTFRASAGSHWEERWLPADLLEETGVPAPIAQVARTLCREIPGSTLILGELIRESVVLDPYLLLARDDEQVCLGVWDDAGVIAAAK